MKGLSELTRDALELPSVERLTLARILLESSNDTSGFSPDIEEAWEQEISRRMDDVKAGTSRSSLSAEVFARLDQRFPG